MSLNTRRSVLLAMLLAVATMNAPTALAQAGAGQKPPTFSKEIVRIFQNRCQSCHHPGARFAPMSLLEYREVRPWAKAIRKKVVLREMPPWHADSSVKKFTNDISISQEEIDIIVRWVDARAPQGNPANLPPMKVFERAWQIEEPDIVLDMGVDFNVPATGTLPLQYFRIDTAFGEDKWLAAMEARPGNPKVVREIVIYVQNPKEGIEVPDGGSLGNGRLGDFSRGYTPSIFNEGEGKLLKRGAKIVFQVHYTPDGMATTDRSVVAFRFHKKPARKHVVSRGIAETGFQIPPHIPNFSVYASHTFPESVTLLSMRPFMHYRGKSFKFIAHYPDGGDEVLLFVDRYNYDWQIYYYPKNPIKLPAGTVLECIAVMDNSHENPKNLEPHAVVSVGDRVLDEKMIGWIDYTLDKDGQASADISS